MGIVFRPNSQKNAAIYKNSNVESTLLAAGGLEAIKLSLVFFINWFNYILRFSYFDHWQSHI